MAGIAYMFLSAWFLHSSEWRAHHLIYRLLGKTALHKALQSALIQDLKTRFCNTASAQGELGPSSFTAFLVSFKSSGPQGYQRAGWLLSFIAINGQDRLAQAGPLHKEDDTVVGTQEGKDYLYMSEIMEWKQWKTPRIWGGKAVDLYQRYPELLIRREWSKHYESKHWRIKKVPSNRCSCVFRRSSLLLLEMESFEQASVVEVGSLKHACSTLTVVKNPVLL